MGEKATRVGPLSVFQWSHTRRTRESRARVAEPQNGFEPFDHTEYVYSGASS